MREAHVHLPLLGRALSMVDLAPCTSVEQVLDALRVQARALDQADPARGRWLLAQGMRIERFREARWPTRTELDAIAGMRPAFAMSFDYHSLVANSAAFAASAIRDDDPDPPADVGVIVRDARGTPTGLLLEGMCRKVRESVPELSPSEQHEAIALALASLERLGFTTVHDMLAPAWLGGVLASMHDAGQLRMRVGLYATLDLLEQQLRDAQAYARPEYVEFLGGKIFVDGTLNARTAWTLAPFADPMNGHAHGTPFMSPDQIAHALRRCADAGVGLAAHAIGDAAVRAVLDAVERVARDLRTEPPLAPPPGDIAHSLQRAFDRARVRPPHPLPHVRIEHAELIDEADVPRFASLGVIASVQPCHLLYDIEVLHKQCPGRLQRVLPLRDLCDAGLEPGATLLFGSDVPIVRANPQDSILAATQRKRAAGVEGCSHAGPPTDPIAPEQALTASQAWAAFAQHQ